MNFGFSFSLSRLGIGGNNAPSVFSLTLDGDTLVASGLSLIIIGNTLEAI